MLDLREIENTIEMLENGDTTFVNCEKLASLYTVRDHLTNQQEDETEKEISDILPSYRVYADTKIKYQNHEVTEEAVVSTLHLLCVEVIDLIKILYTSTEMVEERQEIGKLIGELTNMYANT